MNKIPITFALMTTVKGHFGVKTRYLETLLSFENALSFNTYTDKLAHIKVAPGPDDIIPLSNMIDEVGKYGLRHLVSEGNWEHGKESHQTNYISDLLKVVNNVKTPYVFIAEDDWQVKCYDGSFIDYLFRATSWLEEDPYLVQVRIPRWSNEANRICNLMKKHGMNRWAHPVDTYHFRHDDYSANPSLYRTRDLRAALLLVMNTNLPKHVEHGVGQALKLISGASVAQFACFNPEKIRIGHRGTLLGEEDNLDEPLCAGLTQ